MYGEVGEMWVRLVVPAGRHKKVMRLANSLPMTGHLGEQRTHEIVKRHWPGIWEDIMAWCRSYPKCPLMKKEPNPPTPQSSIAGDSPTQCSISSASI